MKIIALNNFTTVMESAVPLPQLTFTCLKSVIKTQEGHVKYVRSQH